MKLNKNYGGLLKKIYGGITVFLRENPLIESFIIGVSGGIDSALVSAIVYSYNRRHTKGIKLIGISMPSTTNMATEISRAAEVKERFCENGGTYYIDPLVEEIQKSLLHSHIDNGIIDAARVGNLKARLRMIKLYDEARKRKGVVLSTDNYTEYLLGFWTLHGDVGDFGIIQELFKTEVYGLSQYIVDNKLLSTPLQEEILQKCIDAKPTDGLGITDNDIVQLNPNVIVTDSTSWRKEYEKIDEVLIEYQNKSVWALPNKSKDALIKLEKTAIIKKHLATKFKRSTNNIKLR